MQNEAGVMLEDDGVCCEMSILGVLGCDWLRTGSGGFKISSLMHILMGWDVIGVDVL